MKFAGKRATFKLIKSIENLINHFLSEKFPELLGMINSSTEEKERSRDDFFIPLLCSYILNNKHVKISEENTTIYLKLNKALTRLNEQTLYFSIFSVLTTDFLKRCSVWEEAGMNDLKSKFIDEQIHFTKQIFDKKKYLKHAIRNFLEASVIRIFQYGKDNEIDVNKEIENQKNIRKITPDNQRMLFAHIKANLKSDGNPSIFDDFFFNLIKIVELYFTEINAQTQAAKYIKQSDFDPDIATQSIADDLSVDIFPHFSRSLKQLKSGRKNTSWAYQNIDIPFLRALRKYANFLALQKSDTNTKKQNPIKKDVSFELDPSKEEKVYKIVKLLTIHINFLNETETSLEDFMKLLRSKSPKDEGIKIYIGCKTAQFSYIQKRLTEYARNFTATNIGASQSFYSINMILITANNLYSSKSASKQIQSKSIIDKIFKENQ